MKIQNNKLMKLLFSFRLCTYNVLSERYTDNDDQFDYCDPLHLSVQYRKLLILKELQG